MSAEQSWQEREQPNWRTAGSDRLGRWATTGIILSVVLHVIALVALNRVKFSMALNPPAHLVTERVKLNPVETTPTEIIESRADDPLPPPPKDTAKLLEDIDILDKLPKDIEMDMRPDAKELIVNAKPGATPLASGAPTGTVETPTKGADLDLTMPEIGRGESLIPRASDSQMVVERGSAKADELDTSVIDNLIKKGAGGAAPRGAIEGSIEDALGMPANVLVGKTTVLPSDLLFAYNSSELRESARVGLLKLGTLIDLNPGLYCWIEGYTDLTGGDQFNLALSQRRADAVKEYLVTSLRIDPKRIVTRGYGKQQPRVQSGTIDEQAPNRRVEIKMRQTLPPPVATTPTVQNKPATPPAPNPATFPAAPGRVEPTPPKAILVKPARALPVDELEIDRSPATPPRARPVEETPPPPRALPPRAVPVEE